LERRRADQTLNFQYAEFLRKHTESDDKEIQYYYRRAFTPNDRQYQAQFWFARYSYLQSTELNQQAVDTFNHIRNGRISIKQRREIKDVLGGESTPRVLTGTVKAKRLDFGFLIMDGNGYEVFFPPKSVNDDLWEALRENDRVSFHLGFSFSGPVAINITPT
jgi:cold shock CspA family protein